MREQRAQRRGRGFTLLEIMVAVSIVGILVALGVSSLGGLVSVERVNSSSTTLARLGGNARIVALNQACPTVLQINGVNYTNTLPNSSPAQAYIYRKADCAATTFGALAEDRQIQNGSLPTALRMKIGATSIDNQSVLIVFAADGTVSAFQAASGGAYAAITMPVNVSVGTNATTTTRTVLFASGANPRAL